MKSKEYRDIIERIVINAMKSAVYIPVGKRILIADMIAKNIHARLYGANVDGVDSPLWGLGKGPTKEASKILEE